MKLLLLTLILLNVSPCRAQEGIAPSKQEIVKLARKADEQVTNFEQANQLASSYISEADFQKGLEYSARAHKAAAALSKNAANAYTSTELLIVLNELALDAANHARVIYRRALSTATSGQTVNLNALSAADSLTKAQSDLTEVSELVGHTTLRLITNVTSNFQAQLRFPREKINELADLLSAQHGTVMISVRNPDSTTNEDASNLLEAFAKAKWNTAGVNQDVDGTGIGSEGLPISDPVGIHIYAITQWLDRAMFVKEALKYFGVDSILETDSKLSDGRLSIVVGRSEINTKADTSRRR